MNLPASRLIGLAVALFINFSVTLPAFGQKTDELQEVNELLKQGELDRALTRVDAYLATRPKDSRGRFLKGVILSEQNKPNDAIKVFTELTHEFPELPEPYNNLAVLYASQGQYDKARTALEMAIRTHPGYATAHENLGDIYAKMASQAYAKAIQLDKTNTTAQTKLKMINELLPAGRATPPPSPKSDKPARVDGAITADRGIDESPVVREIRRNTATTESSDE
jgi:tetratricopeptide (TPR) repeat protein